MKTEEKNPIVSKFIQINGDFTKCLLGILLLVQAWESSAIHIPPLLQNPSHPQCPPKKKTKQTTTTKQQQQKNTKEKRREEKAGKIIAEKTGWLQSRKEHHITDLQPQNPL